VQWLNTWPFKVEVRGSSPKSCNLVGETNLGLGLLGFISHVKLPNMLGF
jgi:hypothetical protein